MEIELTPYLLLVQAFDMECSERSGSEEVGRNAVFLSFLCL
jgi:hypothetical protein